MNVLIISMYSLSLMLKINLENVSAEMGSTLVIKFQTVGYQISCKRMKGVVAEL